ncbi:DUF305 domain-containing protein [Flavobacterium sp. GT3R68]|uniref:DUF305 domain-containing protein n=1 Tax=Flavobacterium sp. GT3R68 TaxID=2594437 RepID=UPI000F86CB95|nr:DUF305 domain-containing protein [Flavobacterium sp. GT3R68]RTY89846.1 DUF305 domain-containing protein [Flavobacterium sp. GSN2]TRW89825.1 DUF305 domain-containing protein [Flavobacterium sp. GT3R68]
MKIKSILLGTAAALLLANCKEKTEQTTEMETTVTDTVSSETGHDMNHSDAVSGESPIMASMQKMMEKMHQLEKTGNADYDLAASMKEHHQGAIDMSAAEINSGTDAKLKEMAQKMTEKQQMEIKELEGIMSQSKGGVKNYDDKDQGLGKAMMDNMKSMMKMTEPTGSIDKDFATIMVKHHQDGIMMGQAILKYAKNAKFKSMTEKMITDQNKDIKELESWLAAH